MASYTEFKISAKFKHDTPKEIIILLNKIVNNIGDLYTELTGSLPTAIVISDLPNLPIEHPFGKCLRWDMLFHSNNFAPELYSGSEFYKDMLGYYHLNIHTEFKNNCGEVELFVDWIRPYTFILEGWYQSEHHDEKTIL
jgi:hypothetical protein